jgi:peptidoglycan hydrolase-like protein with peptidoglycan-binding domain
MPGPLRNGDVGPEVRAVQDALNHHVRRLAPLDVDGKFGPLTEARVREFQKSNKLQVDGVVGPETSGKLYEAALVPINLMLAPKLQLTPPTFGPTAKSPGDGIKPPTLVPPLQWPGPGPAPQPWPNGPLPGPNGRPARVVNLNLPSASTAWLPPLPNGVTVYKLTMTAPVRNDPADPNVRSYQEIVGMLNHLPQDFPFRATLIGAVPNPTTDPIPKVSLPPSGFDWGVKPIVKPKLDPFQLEGGASVRAAYLLHLSGTGDPKGFNLRLGAWGDGKATFLYKSDQALSQIRVTVSGQIILGAVGTF